MGFKDNLSPGWHDAVGKERRGINKNPVVYIKECLGLTTHQRRLKEANMASGNGKCWWIYQWIMGEYKAQTYVNPD